jgi:lysophospholipase L1-like esterase
MSVQVSYKKQTLFGIILLLCIFSIFESGSRFYEFFMGYCGLENDEILSEYDYFLIRTTCYDFQNIAYDTQPVLTIIPNQHFTTVNINNDGFRGAEINESKTNNDYRIIVIGGSTVFGAGVGTDNNTFPYELNNKFKEKFNNVEVINAGISSLTSFEELYHFKEKLIQLEPNLVIIYDGWNDVGYKRTNEPEILNTDENKLQLKDFQKYLRTPVVLYRYVLLPILDLQSSSNLDPNNTPTVNKLDLYDPQISNSVASLWYKHMNEFCQISKENQIQSVIILQPTLNHGTKPLTNYERSNYVKNIYFEKTFELLIQKSKDLNDCSMVSDFSNVFIDVTRGVYLDQGHLNPFGNKIIAEKIYEKILPIVLDDISK